MKHLLLIAPPQSYRVVPYLEAARARGVHVTIASQGEYALVNRLADGIRVDFARPGEAVAVLVKAHALQPFDAVIGTDDISVELSSQVAAILGLPHNPPAAARYSRRKDLARDCLQAAGVRTPSHRLLEAGRGLAAQLERLDYPCVLKPVGMSMSRGVIRANDAAEAAQACARIEAILREAVHEEERQQILAEQYIDGIEVAYEGLLHECTLRDLVLFDKPEPLTGPFFEETYYITPSRLTAVMQRLVHDTVAAACDAYGLVTGPVHAELRIDAQGQAWLIEIAARTIGGECARLIELATGQSLEALVIANALGESGQLPQLQGAAGVLMLPTPASGVLRRVEGVLAAQQVTGIRELVLSVREGYRLVPLPEGSSYLGFIFATADEPLAVEAALRQAHAKLKIVIAPVFDIHDRRGE
ncbi:MAG: ATP-grasp domain-containing protein [Granulosicoccaceae bacterium]